MKTFILCLSLAILSAGFIGCSPKSGVAATQDTSATPSATAPMQSNTKTTRTLSNGRTLIAQPIQRNQAATTR